MLVAEKLGMTLAHLREHMTIEELQLWSVFYDVRAAEEKKMRDKTMRSRR